MIDDVFARLTMNDIRRELEVLRSELNGVRNIEDQTVMIHTLDNCIAKLDRLLFAICSAPSR